MGKSALISIIAVVALVLWMVSGQFGSDAADTDRQSTDASMAKEEKQAPKMKVQIQKLQAKSIEREVVIQGQLEPAKVLTLRTETSGTIQLLNFNKGQRIRRGQTLARLSEGNRVAEVAVAKAYQIQANNEYQATRKLSKQGLQSQLSMENAAAKRESAKAQLQAAEQELAYINVAAPIDALIEDVIVKEGDFVERGSEIATLVDDSKLLVSGRVPQQHIADIKNGQAAVARLVTGGTHDGKVSFVSSMAEDTTRSFKIEVLIDQPPANIVTGISAQINIPVETLMAHRVSPAVLALDDNGNLGVKTLAEDNTVAFREIKIVKTESNGAWVTGLPNEVTLITLGQGFVNPGEEVEPISDSQTANEAGENITPEIKSDNKTTTSTASSGDS